jgi:enterochelin esterase family protein
MTTMTSAMAWPGPLAALLAGGTPTREAVDRFVADHEFPLVEGSACTFVWRGEAQAVHLMHMIFGLPARQPFRRIAGTDLWALTMELPPASRVEYKLELERGPARELIEDPLNPHHTRDPFGQNSVVHGEGYVTPVWTQPDPEARQGALEELVFPSRALKRDTRITVYLPARFRATRRYPLLYVHDGGDFIAYAGMKTVLDNLIHRLDIPEMVVAFDHPGQRLVEFADHEPHARFVADELVPWLEERYPLAAEPAARGLMGSSFGAVAALSTAVRYPERFGRLMLMSGSFAFTDIGPNPRGPVFEPVVAFVNAFRREPKRVAERLFVSCGRYESLIYENRSIVPILQSTGMDVRYVESRDGHNWQNWRDRLREGLAWLYPGPLWMVYE